MACLEGTNATDETLNLKSVQLQNSTHDSGKRCSPYYSILLLLFLFLGSCCFNFLFHKKAIHTMKSENNLQAIINVLPVAAPNYHKSVVNNTLARANIPISTEIIKT